MRNPFARNRRDPIDQALGAVEDIRAEAAKRAAGIRDAAAQAADMLGEAAPEARRHRVPLALGLIAAAIGTVVALRSRRREAPLPVTAETAAPTAAATAAKATAAQATDAAAPAAMPAAEVAPEEPKEPRAATEESEAAAEEAKQ